RVPVGAHGLHVEGVPTVLRCDGHDLVPGHDRNEVLHAGDMGPDRSSPLTVAAVVHGDVFDAVQNDRGVETSSAGAPTGYDLRAGELRQPTGDILGGCLRGRLTNPRGHGGVVLSGAGG